MHHTSTKSTLQLLRDTGILFHTDDGDNDGDIDEKPDRIKNNSAAAEEESSTTSSTCATSTDNAVDFASSERDFES